jgi:acyl-CoA synthetase (AMP-forming)/AMP-acid ligase II
VGLGPRNTDRPNLWTQNGSDHPTNFTCKFRPEWEIPWSVRHFSGTPAGFRPQYQDRRVYQTSIRVLLLREVSSIANILKSFGLKKGGTVSFYLPMMWQTVAFFLACARIGAVQLYLPASLPSLCAIAFKIVALVLLSPQTRAGEAANQSQLIKVIVDAALNELPLVGHVLVLSLRPRTRR